MASQEQIDSFYRFATEQLSDGGRTPTNHCVFATPDGQVKVLCVPRTTVSTASPVLGTVTAVTNIAKALGLPAETLLAKAAGLVPGLGNDSSDEPKISTEQAIRQDQRLADDQKLALLSVYRSFVDDGPDA